MHNILHTLYIHLTFNVTVSEQHLTEDGAHQLQAQLVPNNRSQQALRTKQLLSALPNQNSRRCQQRNVR